MTFKSSIPKLHSFNLKGRENVEVLEVMTYHDIPVERVLLTALEKKLKNVTICGEYEDGTTYHAASWASMAEVVLSLRRMEKHLLELLDPADEGYGTK